MITTLDRYGRIVIPKKLREHLGITRHTNLNIKEEGERIVIEPIHSEDVLVNKEGILVYTGNISSEINDLLKANRNNRIRKLYNEDNN